MKTRSCRSARRSPPPHSTTWRSTSPPPVIDWRASSAATKGRHCGPRPPRTLPPRASSRLAACSRSRRLGSPGAEPRRPRRAPVEILRGSRPLRRQDSCSTSPLYRWHRLADAGSTRSAQEILHPRGDRRTWSGACPPTRGAPRSVARDSGRANRFPATRRSPVFFALAPCRWPRSARPRIPTSSQDRARRERPPPRARGQPHRVAGGVEC